MRKPGRHWLRSATSRARSRRAGRDIELFTELTGDRNPLHYDEDAAARSRFGGLIVQGGVTSGLLNAVVAEDLAGREACSARRLELHGAGAAGDEITAEVEVIEVREDKPAHPAPDRDREPGGNGRPRRNGARGGQSCSEGTALLAAALVLSMTTWFSATAVVPQLRDEWDLGNTAAAWLTIAVQVGFVAGALARASVWRTSSHPGS